VGLWGQAVTVDDVEEFFGADQWTIATFVWATLILVVAVLIARPVRRGVQWVLLRYTSLPTPTVRAITRIVGWAIILIGIVEALWVIGIDIGPGVMILLVVAVIMFFAGRGVMANFSAGLVLQGSAMFDVGDQVATPAGTGTVQSVAGRTVVIKTPDGVEIHIPNKTMIESPITNLTRQGSRLSSIVVGVAYGTDPQLAKTVLIDAAARCDEVHAEPPPEALISEFSDSSIDIQIRFWHAPTILDQLRAVDAVAGSITSAFAAHGITIAFPQRTLSWAEIPTDASTLDNMDTPERNN